MLSGCSVQTQSLFLLSIKLEFCSGIAQGWYRCLDLSLGLGAFFHKEGPSFEAMILLIDCRHSCSPGYSHSSGDLVRSNRLTR
jgi:hypothetical protein